MSERLTDNELHQTMDAQIWASEFVARHEGDESLMLGWFANAIMTGYDEGQRSLENRIRILERALSNLYCAALSVEEQYIDPPEEWETRARDELSTETT